MLNQKSFHIDGSTHSPFNQTYVERHEFKDHSPPARFRRIKAKQPLSGTRAHDFEAADALSPGRRMASCTDSIFLKCAHTSSRALQPESSTTITVPQSVSNTLPIA
jgi:hypothetical protein